MRAALRCGRLKASLRVVLVTAIWLLVTGLAATPNAAQTFTEIDEHLYPFSSVAWGDYDNDGDLDLLLTSSHPAPDDVSYVYRNDGGGILTETEAIPDHLGHSPGVWGDFDNDGDLDLLATDTNGSAYLSRIYRNDGGGVFTSIAELAGATDGSVALGDYDNDGDLDVLLTGWDLSVRVSKLYRNDGGGVFTEIAAGLPGVDQSSAAWGDYDNDGDLDILLSGDTGSGFISKIYRNDGGGVFTDIGADLVAVRYSSVAWGDYDHDGDLDILLTGGPKGSCCISKVYRNDGGGVFTDIAAGLTGVLGSAAWGDFDNDGDLDVLLSGSTGYQARVSKVYRNDGGGVFTDIAAGLVGVWGGSATWADVDNDGDLDILLTGDTGSGHVSKIYRNDISVANTAPTAPSGLTTPCGSGQVTLAWNAASDAQTPAAGLTYNLRVATTPGGVDILSPMAATDTGWRRVPQLGSANHGTFAVLIKPLPPGTYYWSVQAVDTAFAGSPFATESTFTIQDASIDPTAAAIAATGGSGTVNVTAPEGCGWNAISDRTWITVTGGTSGSGNGTVSYSVAANAGVARTGTITIAGETFTVSQAGKIEEVAAGLTGVLNGSVAWGDYDNDGDLDVLLTGYDGSAAISKIYRNDGDDVFTDIGAGLAGVTSGSAVWGDFDNDGDLDILLCGATGGSGRISKVYRNDGSDVFTDIAAGLSAVWRGSIAWGDYDNDGDLDILLTGDPGSDLVSKIYRNDGGGVFTDIGAELVGVRSGSVAWGDYDNDGDLDILLTGDDGPADISKVYRNDGEGVFTDIEADLAGVRYGSAAWGDFDDDGDLDVLLTGYSGSARVSKVYRNDGGGAFTDIDAALAWFGFSSATWGDFDNDGDLDILITGYDGSADVSTIYRNEDGGAFTDIGVGLVGVRWGSAAWGDVDNDGDLDILLTGATGSGYVSKIYRNDISVANTAPTAPSGLTTPCGSGQATLAWNAASDTQTPAAGLTYNLRVSTAPGGIDILSPMAATNTGWRRVPQLGNANHGATAVLTRPLPPGTYYWSVQAVDTAFAGSPFAAESTFTIQDASIDPTSAEIASAGGSGTVAVTAPEGCEWSAISDRTWITVTEGASDSGNGTVSYSVAANAGGARSGTITIAGETFTVNQAAALYTLTVSKDGTGSGTVTSDPAGIDCGETCSHDFEADIWVELTPSPEDGSVFSGWSGCGGASGFCTVSMSQARSVTATFTSCTVVESGRDISGTELITSCGSLSLGPSLAVVSPGDLTARAASMVVLRNGFSVGPEGRFTAGTDPSLGPP